MAFPSTDVCTRFRHVLYFLILEMIKKDFCRCRSLDFLRLFWIDEPSDVVYGKGAVGYFVEAFVVHFGDVEGAIGVHRFYVGNVSIRAAVHNCSASGHRDFTSAVACCCTVAKPCFGVAVEGNNHFLCYVPGAVSFYKGVYSSFYVWDRAIVYTNGTFCRWGRC